MKSCCPSDKSVGRSALAMMISLVGAVSVGWAAESPHEPKQASHPGPPNYEDYATIEAHCEGVPVYSLGNITYIYGVSPDLLPGVVMQEGNGNPRAKIRPKKSWEIESNVFGAYPVQPSVRTMWNDSQPLLPIHLIDGDPDTAWCSY